ncbi:hypothetical protein [Limnoraphis robusta]|uniref:Uncharacterized protein n=1 Tax=Limnoraphis robusta CCNP1315 TaxID=3110306 RepID=A0ABU5U668_9CYAN|nr:hypothetical protein [Limnoraphis robusta]MEA5522692.1 hypothetical protein [Limnoraphis robusta CCNP1315]MEA5547432.1 hypothetical protein [Limnoraphis robusta CCNP1324]
MRSPDYSNNNTVGAHGNAPSQNRKIQLKTGFLLNNRVFGMELTRSPLKAVSFKKQFRSGRNALRPYKRRTTKN